MKEKATFSNKRVLLVFAVIGLLLGAVLAVAIFNASSASAQVGKITAEEAKAAAEAAFPGAKVIEVERDDSGLDAYEVEMDNGTEVIVDANSGEIITSGTDDADTGEDANGDDGEDADGVEE